MNVEHCGDKSEWVYMFAYPFYQLWTMLLSYLVAVRNVAESKKKHLEMAQANLEEFNWIPIW